MWGYLLLLLSLQKRCYFSTFLASEGMREAGIGSETHAMGGTHEKGAIIFPRLFYRAFHCRACLALHTRSCSTAVKKTSVLQATLRSKSVDKILWCLHFKCQVVELLLITIYLCFKISEQTWIWFFCEFFLWSLLLSSDRVTRFKRLGYFFALNKYKPANYIKHKILVRVR